MHSEGWRSFSLGELGRLHRAGDKSSGSWILCRSLPDGEAKEGNFQEGKQQSQERKRETMKWNEAQINKHTKAFKSTKLHTVTSYFSIHQG